MNFAITAVSSQPAAHTAESVEIGDAAIVTNPVAPFAHVPVAVVAEVPAAADVHLPNADEAPAVVGDVFVGLLPSASRATIPASNDDVADDDGGEASGGQSRSDASRQLRRAMAPRLTRARLLSGWSQGDVARLIGLKGQTQVALWEGGQRLVPLPYLVRLAEVLGVSESYLLGSSFEVERDPAAALRHACLRGVRTMLTRVAEVTVDEVARHVRLSGPHAGNVRALLGAGDALIEAVGAFIRHNDHLFSDQLGSAKLVRRAEEFEAALAEARAAIRLHDARDADLARALAALGDADPLPAEDDEA